MAVSDNKKSTRTSAARKPTKATSASDWKKSSQELPLVETPTGKWVRFKKPGMTKFLESGFLPDSLASLVQKEIANASKRPGTKAPDDKAMLAALTKDLDADGVADMMASLDRIIVAVMVEPPFAWHRRPVRTDPTDPDSPVKLDDKGREVTEEIPEDKRREDVVYTDQMEQEDKNFIFAACVGGSTDLARFRAQSSIVMDALSAGEGVEEAPQRTPAPGA
jgi:hypothetical protein